MLRLGQVSSKYSRVNSSIQDSPSPSYIRCLRAASLPHLLAHSLALTCLGQLDATTAPRLAATLAAEPRETWAELQRPIGDEVIRRVAPTCILVASLTAAEEMLWLLTVCAGSRHP